MKNVLITGGLGFIGSHLVDYLDQLNLNIVIVDNKTTNVVENQTFKNKCLIVNKSIKDVDFSKLSQIDTVFHLASILGPSGVLKHAGDIGFSILNDSIILRDFCIQNKALFIDMSTSEVYGHPGILNEDSQKVFPGQYQIRTEYGGGKMIAEMAVVNKSKFEKNLKFHIIRPFNVTGPRQKPDGGFVLPRFVIAALTNQPLTVFGDGTQRRAFTHVNDICEATLKIASSKFRNEIWNVGNPPNEMSINEIADLVIKLAKNKFSNLKPKKILIDPKKIHGKYFAEAIDKIPYTKKINTKLHWFACRNAEKIINDTLDYYHQKIGQGYYFKVL